MPNGTYGGVRGRKTKVGRKLSFSSYSICSPLCSCVAVALCVTLRLRCVCCIVLRCVACVVFVALRLRFVEVAFRCASGCCASFQAVLSRFGWLFPAAPGSLRTVPCSAEHKIGIFVRFLASGPPFSALSSTKSTILCQNGRFF